MRSTHWITAAVVSSARLALGCSSGGGGGAGGGYVHYLGDVSCTGATLQWPCDSENPEFGFRCCSK